MKKIFFIFTMLLMSVVSVWAEESSETIFLDIKNQSEYIGECFKIEGTPISHRKYTGLLINGDNRITITANDGERITKVIFNSELSKF